MMTTASATAPSPSTETQAKIDAGLAGAEAIVFYDGTCGLCDKFIQFMLARDKRRVFRYAQQQGATFAGVTAFYPQFADLSTVVVAERLAPSPAGGGQDWQAGWRYSRLSTASLRAMRRLGGGWALFSNLSLLIPPLIRHAVYKLIAKNRYRLFGQVDACRLPSKEERALFLP